MPTNKNFVIFRYRCAFPKSNDVSVCFGCMCVCVCVRARACMFVCFMCVCIMLVYDCVFVRLSAHECGSVD